MIWGQPSDDFTPVEASSEKTRVLLAAADYDSPVVLGDDGSDAVVTRAAAEIVVPDPATIAASAPVLSDDPQEPRLIGEPIVVSLVPSAPVDAAEATGPSETAGGPLLQVTGTRVNMRSGPSTSNAVVDSLPRGALAEPIGAPVNGWQEIRSVDTGQTGFMAARFLSPS